MEYISHEEIAWADGEFVFRGSITDDMVERAANVLHMEYGQDSPFDECREIARDALKAALSTPSGV